MASYSEMIEKLKKDWNCPSLMDAANRNTGRKLPFSSPLLNYSTYGGIPRNAVTEFYGYPGGGKSSSSVDICKNANEIFVKEYDDRISELRELANSGNKSALVEIEELEERGPKKVLYIDLEHSFDSAWAETLGIAHSEIDIMQPPDVVAEDILQFIRMVIQTGELGLIVIDSIPSLVSKAELDKKIGERTVAPLAGLLTTFLREIIPLLTRYETTLLCINQLRDNLENPYAPRTPGGNALKFYASLRILFQIGSPVDFVGNDLPQKAENPAGYIINAKITKQKSAPWDRRNGSYYLMAKSGIRVDMDFCQLAVKKYGIIKKSGAWFTLCDPITGEMLEDPITGKPLKINGFAKILEYVQNNPDYYNKLKSFIIDDIEGNPNSVAIGNSETVSETISYD
jgi:recombination protein RecA